MTPVQPPGYWMNETSGVLRPAIEAYLYRTPMTPEQVAAMRAYLRQWIMHPGWHGSMVDVLRSSLDELHSRADIRRWLDRALEAGIDPI